MPFNRCFTQWNWICTFLIFHRPESIKELHIQLEEVDSQESNLEAQLSTLSELKEGKIPEPEEISVPEPIIKTVEVSRRFMSCDSKVQEGEGGGGGRDMQSYF